MRFVFLCFFITTLGAKAQMVDVERYLLSIYVNDANDSLQGEAGILFRNKAGKREVQFDLASIDAAGHGMRVDGVHDIQKRPLSFSHRDNKLTIQLNEPLKDSPQLVSVVYRGIPGDGLIIAKNRFGDRTFFSDNWPNRARHWMPCNDRPDDKAAFHISVAAPAAYQVISNGTKQSEKNLGDGLKETYWAEETPLPTKVMAVGIARFAIRQYKGGPGNLPVSAWVYPQDSTKGFYDYGLTPTITQFFSGYLAPFPFQKLANVQSTTIFGGLENASCIFYAESLVTGDRRSEDLMAHEIVHQWFGNMATEKSFAHLWLSEGFATYLTHHYMEQRYGRQVLVDRLQNDRREVVLFARSSSKAVVDSTEDLMSLLNANSYQKGAWVLHMLRGEVGDSTFQEIVRTYYNLYKGGNAETRDFQRVAEQVSGKDLGWFFDQWLYRPGVPKLSVLTFNEGNVKKIKIVQTGPVYRLPLTLLITDEGGQTVRENLLLSGRETESTWQGSATTRVTVRLDPDTNLLFEEVKK